jgi:hypothetical protein
MTKREIHIDTPEDMGERFIDAWKRAERGEEVDEKHLTFPSLEVLVEALEPYLRKAHKYSDHHRASIETGAPCGCFCCKKAFDPKDLPMAIDPVFLAAMEALWFSPVQPSHQGKSDEPE